MQLTWQQKDFESDLDFILFHQKDGTPVWWHKRLFDVYPDLDYNYCWNSDITEEQRFQYITEKMKIQSQKRADDVAKSINTFKTAWNSVSNKLNAVYSNAFDNDCSVILNDMTACVSLNPVCPRDIETHSFNMYHYFDPKLAVSMATHEITHFVWFYFWQKHFQDNPEDYDFPNIKWLLSEIVVETINRDSGIANLSEQPKHIAYSYFYDMEINGELIFDTMKKMYLERKDIFDFMEKSFEWIKANEPELRAKIAEAERQG